MTRNKIVEVKTRIGVFECIFQSNAPEKGYTVTVPKLRGIVTFGENLNIAKKMAQEAIELHCECLLRGGLAEVKIRRQARGFLKKEVTSLPKYGLHTSC